MSSAIDISAVAVKQPSRADSAHSAGLILSNAPDPAVAHAGSGCGDLQYFPTCFPRRKGLWCALAWRSPPNVARGMPRLAVSGEWLVERALSLQGIGDNS